MLISTNGGLWRYLIGDTVMFTTKNPFRIRITGRTKSFINAFGEELIIDNAEKALSIASEKCHAIITEYTAAPVYLMMNSLKQHTNGLSNLKKFLIILISSKKRLIPHLNRLTPIMRLNVTKFDPRPTDNTRSSFRYIYKWMKR